MSNLMVLPSAVALYPELLVPKKFKKDGKELGEPKYSMLLIFDPADPDVAAGLNAAKAAAVKACQDEWPNRNVVADIRAGNIEWPFKKGDALAAARENKGKKGDIYKGMEVLKVSSDYAPEIIDRARKEIINPKELYSGMAVRVEANFKAGSFNGDYVKAYFNFVMKTAEGTRIGGRTAAGVFEGIDEPEEVTDAGIRYDDGAAMMTGL